MTAGPPRVTRTRGGPALHTTTPREGARQVAIYLHATPPPGGRPDTAPLARQRLYNAAYRGEIPAEALDQAGREHLVYDLWLKHWTDVEIAVHTRMTTYTTGRIRTRLGLAPHSARKEVAA